MTRIKLLLSGLLMFSLCSCEHRPFEHFTNSHYIRIYINDSIPNNTCNFYIEAPAVRSFDQPEVMRVILCNPNSGEVQTECFLQHHGNDCRGHYLDGEINANPGCYHLLAYNYGTEKTIIRNERNFWKIQAYTNPIANHIYNNRTHNLEDGVPNKPRFDPDHLFVVSKEEIQIHPTMGRDTLYDHGQTFFEAKSVVKSYYIQIYIKGIKWVTNANAILSGMTGSIKLFNEEVNEEDAADLFFSMGINIQPLKVTIKNDENTATLFATFNTFGKLPDRTTQMNVTFEFTKTTGELQKDSIILTPMFLTNDVKINRWLIIKREIEVQPPKPNDSISPDIEDWEDVNFDVTL